MPDSLSNTAAIAPLDVMPTTLLHSIPDACFQLGGISRTSLYRVLRAGHLVAVTVQGRRMIPHQSLVEFVGRAIDGSGS